MTDGTIVEGEEEITLAHKKIDKIKYKNKIKVTDEVLSAIAEADLIIIGIGSLYTSIIPNLLTKEVKKALINAKAKKMYICNIMSQHGETDGFKASDCIKEINKYVCKDFIDVVLTNSTKINNEILERYKEEISEPIFVDKETIKKMNVELINKDLLNTKDNQAKHDSLKTALEVFSYLTKGD